MKTNLYSYTTITIIISIDILLQNPSLFKISCNLVLNIVECILQYAPLYHFGKEERE